MLSMSPTTPGTQGSQSLAYIASPTSARSQAFKRPASSDDDVEHDENGRQQHGRRNAAVKRGAYSTFMQSMPVGLLQKSHANLCLSVQ
jgi:hypothetical protein